MTYMNMKHELKSLTEKYFGSILQPIVLDSFLTDLMELIVVVKICDDCGTELFWDSRASAYTDEDGRTSTVGISSNGHHHVVHNVKYKFSSLEMKNNE